MNAARGCGRSGGGGTRASGLVINAPLLLLGEEGGVGYGQRTLQGDAGEAGEAGPPSMVLSGYEGVRTGYECYGRRDIVERKRERERERIKPQTRSGFPAASEKERSRDAASGMRGGGGGTTWCGVVRL